MKKIILLTVCAMLTAPLSYASSVGPIIPFEAKTRALANEVNANFTSLKNAVDDNFLLIDAHKKNLAIHGGNGTTGGVGGDGTAGVLDVASNNWVTGTNLPSNFNFTSCVIGKNATATAPETVTLPSGTTIRCQDGFTLNANTTLVVAGGFGAGVARLPFSGQLGAKGMQKMVVMSSLDLMPLGGAGFNSGGFLRILSNGPIKINGIIKANGNSGAATIPAVGTGGGAGGIIVLQSEQDINVAGSIQANGATGQAGTTQSYGSGGGGGGIVVLVSPVITSANNVSVSAGSAGAEGGGFEPRFGNGGSACGGNGGDGYPRPVGAINPIAATAGYVVELVGQPSSLIP